MRRVYRTTHKEIDICCFFKQQTANHRSTVTVDTPLFIFFVILQIVFCIMQHFVNGNDPFCDQIDPFQFCRGRYI